MNPPKLNKSSWNCGIFTNIFTPRPYQIELLECAVKQNTIICVNTEPGKRFISTMLIREMIVKKDNPEQQHSLAILLLNDETLVRNQSELLQSHLNLDVKACTKEHCANLNTQDWKSLFTSYQVLTISPELLLGVILLDPSLVQLIYLIIFDECHFVRDGSHPYRDIMKIFDGNHVTPNILGLTMSLLRDQITADKLKEEIEEMEFLLHSKAQTATDLIALDRHALLQPSENIILSADQHKNQDLAISNLMDEMKSILRNTLAWLDVCKIQSSSEIRIIDWEVTALSEKLSDDTLIDEQTMDETDSETNKIEENSNNSTTCADSLDSHDTEEDDKLKDVCNASKKLIKEILTVLDVLGPWCVYKLIELIIKQLHKAILSIERRLKALVTDDSDEEEPTSGPLLWQKILFQYVNTTLRMVYTMCHYHMGEAKTVDLKFVSPKVHRLLQVLKEYKPSSEPEQKQAHKYNDRSEANYVSWWQNSDTEDDDDERECGQKKKNQKNNSSTDDSYTSPFTNTLCGIVFVEERYVAMMLHRLLRDVCKEDSDLKHVTSSHLGVASEENPQLGIYSTTTDKTKQEEVVRKFRCHETNLLITTGGLENCAYMPKCNLIVRFDVAKSYRAYSQSKSRARAHTSAYVMLVRETEKHEFIETLQEYKRIEQVLQGSSYLDEDEGILEDGEEAEDYDNVIPPYSPSSTASVTMRNAIKIVNRYCSRLPSDPFTHLSPRCDVSEEIGGGYLANERMYRCTLQLPINSHVREPIKGILMPSVILAQQAVAMEACKRLHLRGELDDNLMPIGKETVKYAEELDPWKPETSSVSGRPGSTKRRQTYVKDIPMTLRSCLPNTDENVFIYEIVMRIKSPLPEQLNVRMRKIYLPEDTPRCFGLLTTKRIPQIPGTPIFTRSGEEIARLRLCRAFVKLSAQEIQLIKAFHRYIFSDTLRVDRVPLSFQPDRSANQLLVVVLNRVPSSRCCPSSSRLDIDWSFMARTDAKRRMAEKMKRDPWYNHRMSDRNKSFTFNRKVYEDGVVVAKYRTCDQPNRFYVAEIKDELDPSSPFPSSEYQSFKQYYSVKYGLDIRCVKQPLLDVDHTSSRLNLLTPRHLNQKGKALPLSSLEKKRAKYESLHNRQILVPELCEAHPIPASLWRKAVCLPSILYRVSQLLVAEELRQDISAKSGITSEGRPLGHTWDDINFGWSGGPTTYSSSIVSKRSLATVRSDHPSNTDLSVPAVSGVSAAEFKKDADACNGVTVESHLDQNVPESLASSSVQSDVTIVNTTNAAKLEKAENCNPSDVDEDQDLSALLAVKSEINSSVAVEPPPSDKQTVSSAQDLKDILSEENSFSKNGSNSSEVVESKIEDEELTDASSVGSCDSDVSFFSDDFEKCFESEDESRKQREKKRKRKRHKKDVPPPNELLYILPKALLNDIQLDTTQIGPGPDVILRALTLSNASDGFNLERLEMLGDSFLKHAVTLYLYCTYPEAHEGKLSYMRSKKVSNYNLYRIGRAFGIAGKMTAHIFDPTVNWMPAGFVVGSSATDDDPDDFSFSDDEVEIGVWTGVPGDKKKSTPVKPRDVKGTSQPDPNQSTSTTSEQKENEEEIYDDDEIQMIDGMLGGCLQYLGGEEGKKKKGNNGILGFDLAGSLPSHRSMHFTDKAALKQNTLAQSSGEFVIDTWAPVDAKGKPLSNSDPLMLDLHNQQSLADKSIADGVEALLGAYLTSCGHRSAQLLLCHMGLTVLPKVDAPAESTKTASQYGFLQAPPNNFTGMSHSQSKVDQLLEGLKGFEKKINYTFKNKAYLLQAFTHASYYYNTVTDCYQRLEFLGDAVLDFLITRYLFNDERQHSPGALTDLRSALVNNTIFASLAVRYDFHKYFKAISPDLQILIEDFVAYQRRQEEAQGMDAQLMRHYGDSSSEQIVASDQSFIDGDEEEDETEDVEVPKTLGDIFESIAGAIFMDSGMDLSQVWEIYSVMMLPLIEKFSACVPRSPVRELLEMEPETAKFSCAEKRYDGKMRVTVEIIGKGRFKGVGRSYRAAKSAAARRALRFLKQRGL